MRWWLQPSSGVRRPITAAGVVLGRAADADFVSEDPAASRQHALVFLGADGPALVPLGRGTIAVNDVAVAKAQEVRAGDRIEVPGLALEVVAEDVVSKAPPRWMLRVEDSALFGLADAPRTVGGSPDDDLHLPGTPAGAVRLVPQDDGLVVEALVDGIAVAGHEVEEGAVVRVGPRTIIGVGAQSLCVVAGGAISEATTAGELPPNEIEAATLQFLPRGGRLLLKMGAREVTAYLSERKCDLMALLLQPPEPYAPGDYIPDEILLRRIWPGADRSRLDVNTLVYRVRKDLVAAGLDGCSALDRVRGGVRARLAADAAITVV